MVSNAQKPIYAPVVGHHNIYKSGSVSRWHNTPDIPAQTVADHQCRVAQIIFFFWPSASAKLIYAALHHDCGELWVGDVPAPMKRENKKLAYMLEQAEADARVGMGIVPFRTDSPKLIFADRLEAFSYASMNCPDLLGKPEWQQALKDLGEMADALGVSDRLVDWLNP